MCSISSSYDNVESNTNGHRVARSYHTAWTPPAYPNSLLLLGGGESSADLSVDILPSDTLGEQTNTKTKYKICFEFLLQVHPLYWNMGDMERAESQTVKPSS